MDMFQILDAKPSRRVPLRTERLDAAMLKAMRHLRRPLPTRMILVLSGEDATMVRVSASLRRLVQRGQAVREYAAKGNRWQLTDAGRAHITTPAA